MVSLAGSIVRRAAAASAAAVLTLTPLTVARADETGTVVKLPTEKDALAVAVNIERILNGSRGIETHLPGPVADRERVDAAVGLDGKLAAVSDDQRMTISGLGDFEFKVAGPATDVEALPGSESEPGLRRGSVIWQGFSDGSKSIGARMDLIPGQEEVRLPIKVALAITVDGKPVEPGHAYDGRLHVRLTVTNNSTLPIQVVDGEIGLAEGAAVLDAIRSELRAGHRPIPGEAGIPAAITVSNPAFRQANLEAPVQVGGGVILEVPRLASVHTAGIEEVDQHPGRFGFAFSTLLGGGSPLSHTADVTATVRGLRVPKVAVTATPAPPSAASVAPPTGVTWSAGVRTNPGAFDPKAMTGLIMDTMWRTARLRQFDAYLGNPDPTGEAATTYRFVLRPAVAAAAPGVTPGGGGAVRAIAGAGIAILIAVGAVVVWSRS